MASVSCIYGIGEIEEYENNGWVRSACKLDQTTLEKDGVIKSVHNSDVEKSLLEGWNVYSYNRNKFIIHKDDKSLFVTEDEFTLLKPNGWKRGSLSFGSAIMYKNGSTKNVACKKNIEEHIKDGWVVVGKSQGKICMNNGEVSKYFQKREQSHMESLGWVIGRLPPKITHPVKNKGRALINKEGVNKFVEKELLEQYLNDGWIKGSCKAEYVECTKGGVTKRVQKSHFLNYDSQSGWVLV